MPPARTTSCPGRRRDDSAVDRLRFPIRDHVTQRRRSLVRFFVCGEDVSLDPPERPLPQAVGCGAEPLLIVGAIAGG